MSALHRSSPDPGKTVTYPIERSLMHIDRRQGWGMHTSLMKIKASSLEVIVFHRVDRVTRSSPAHSMKSSTSVVLNGRIVMVDDGEFMARCGGRSGGDCRFGTKVTLILLLLKLNSTKSRFIPLT